MGIENQDGSTRSCMQLDSSQKKFCLSLGKMRENICLMSKALRTLRAVQWSMLASILVYTVLGELVGPRSRGVDPGLSYLFSTLAVGIVGAIFVVRRTLCNERPQAWPLTPTTT
jgi:hypothetical protein